MVGGFFPTPYPDECYYSILCRYYVRSGSTSYERTTRELFGNRQCLSSTIFFPTRLERLDNWVSPTSLLSRKIIAMNHTMYPYMAMAHSPGFRAEMECVMNGGRSTFTLDRIGETKSFTLWPKYLRFCHCCVKEDIALYGETYWHRLHQLPGMIYCTKHLVRLADSYIQTQKTSTSFIAASDAIAFGEAEIVQDNLSRHKENFLTIAKESEWILIQGLAVDWNFDFQMKYKRLLREVGVVTIQCVSDYVLISNQFNDYWGEDFLKTLFSSMSDKRDWIRQLQAARLRTFKPIYHILLMCFLKGSVKAFLESEPHENPFGEYPWPCENPICVQYKTGGCQNTELRYVSGIATGFFECDKCGMIYKQLKSIGKTGGIIIVDYGHIWKDKLFHYLETDKMTMPEAAVKLKCKPHIIRWQQKKLGLVLDKKLGNPSRKYDKKTDGCAFHKERVMRILEQYQEVTYSMIRQLAPGSYEYLLKRDPAWLREHIIYESGRAISREADQQMLKRVQTAVEWIKKEGDWSRKLTIGYIASVAGVRKYKLKPSQLWRPLTTEFLDSVVESKEDWLRRRITEIWKNKDESETISVADIKREISIIPNTYRRYHDFIEKLIEELNKK